MAGAAVNASDSLTEPPHWLAIRPMVPVAVALILGVTAYTSMPDLPWVWLSIALALLATATCRLERRDAEWCVIGAAGLLGLAAAQASAFRYPADQVARYTTDQPRLARLRLSFDREPRLVTIRTDTPRPMPPKQAALARVEAVYTWDGWKPATGDALVQIKQPNPRLAAGQVAEVLCKLERPSPSVNPGQFDWSSYYRDQRVVVSVGIDSADQIIPVESHGPSTWEWLIRWTRQKLSAGFAPRDSLDHALLRALLLGDHDPELRDVQEAFKRTGTSHHLAISGMHIAVVAGVVFFVLRALFVAPRTAWAISLIVVAIYGAVALPSPPVVRAVLLWFVLGVGLLCRRRADAVHLLSVVVVAMLLYHPLDLFNAGFQLSFGTVLGLLLLAEPMRLRLGGDDELDRIARRGEKLSLWQQLGRRVDHSAMGALSAALVAWLVSLPLIAWHFGQLNTWAVLCSIALAPVVFAALMSGVLKVLLTMLLPAWDETWATAAAFFVRQMRVTVEFLATWPWADIPLPKPPLWLLAAYYVALVLALCPWLRPSVRWLTRGSVAACLFAIFILPFASGSASTQAASQQRAAVSTEGELRFTLLAVGAGQCAVVEPPGDRVVLIDAGSFSLTDLVRKCVAPFLRERGVTAIDSIFVTHANTDHYSGVAELADVYGAREVLVHDGFPAEARLTPTGELLLRELDAIDRPPRTVLPGDVIPLARDTELRVLHPPKAAGLASNDSSLVVMLTHAGRRVLFTGDIEDAAMRGLLNGDRALLRADVLIAPHHGSSEASTGEFVDAVGPAIILASDDRTPTGKQRRFDALVAQRGITLWRTHDHGAITVVIDRRGNVRVETYLTKQVVTLPAK
jgi:competence protein ComEC